MTFLRSWGLPFALSFLLSASALAMYQKVGVEFGAWSPFTLLICCALLPLLAFTYPDRKNFSFVLCLLGTWICILPWITNLPGAFDIGLEILPFLFLSLLCAFYPLGSIQPTSLLAGSGLGILVAGFLLLPWLGGTPTLWGSGFLVFCLGGVFLHRWILGWKIALWIFLSCLVLASSVFFHTLSNLIPTIFLLLFLVVPSFRKARENRIQFPLPYTLFLALLSIFGICYGAVRMLDVTVNRSHYWFPGFILLSITMFLIGHLLGRFVFSRKKHLIPRLRPILLIGVLLWGTFLLIPWGFWNNAAHSLGDASYQVVIAWICSLGFLTIALLKICPSTKYDQTVGFIFIAICAYALWEGSWKVVSLFALLPTCCALIPIFFSMTSWKKSLVVLPILFLVLLWIFLPTWPKGLEKSVSKPEGVVGSLESGYRLNRQQVGVEGKSGASVLTHLPFLLRKNEGKIGLITYAPPIELLTPEKKCPFVLVANLYGGPRFTLGDMHPRPWLRYHPAAFDVLIVSPDEDRRPEVLAGADGLAILKNSLSDQGILCFIFPIDRVSVKELQARVAGFVKVFPSSCCLWTQGGFLALIGSKRDTPLKIDPRRWEAALKNETIRQDLSWSDFGGEGSYLSRPENFFAGYICGAETLRFLSRGVKPLSGDLTPASRPKEAPVDPLVKILVEHLDQIDQAFAGAPPAWTNQAEEHRSRYLLPEMMANKALINAQRQEIWGYSSNADGLRENAVRLNPRNLMARALVGRTMLLSGRPKEAREILEAVLVEDPKHFQALMFMATLSMMEKDPAKADDYLAKAVISAPKNSQALMTLAQMRLGAGKNAEALKLAQRAAAISPEDPQIQHSLAQTLAANGDKTQAITIWRGLLKDPTISPELLITIANTIQTLDPGLGLEFANRCHSLSPENPWTMLMLARLQFLNKQTDQAKKNCAEAKRQAQSLGDARLLKACESLEMELLKTK